MLQSGIDVKHFSLTDGGSVELIFFDTCPISKQNCPDSQWWVSSEQIISGLDERLAACRAAGTTWCLVTGHHNRWEWDATYETRLQEELVRHKVANIWSYFCG
jgi:hypothetical protein